MMQSHFHIVFSLAVGKEEWGVLWAFNESREVK